MAQPAHYDIVIVPGEYYDDEFIYPADFTGWQIDFYFNDVVVRSTRDHTLAMTPNAPATGETTMQAVFSMDETLAMDHDNTYRIVGTDLAGNRKPIFYGKFTVMEDP